MISELHTTHLSDSSMINLAKGQCYWPGMRKELKNIYKGCEVCLENVISKLSSPHEVIPSSLHLLQPNEIVHLDYMEINGINILVLKCKGTGWNWARVMHDKTAETTCKMFKRYITSYDRPRLVVTDHGPAFSSNFIEFLSSHHIEHHYSSYYRPMSNSPAERTVRSIKDVLKKIPNFSEKNLRTAVFGINQHQAQDGSGSPSESFFKRHIRSGLSKLIRKELQHEDLMRI